MKYAITNIVEQLKAAREDKNLNQRELSQLAGIPQSHISKIESGNVDLRVSSLIELSRALDLELTLVPRKKLPAVNTIVRGSVSQKRFIGNEYPIEKELKRIENTIADLIRKNPTNTQLAQIQSQAKDFQRLKVPDSFMETIRRAEQSLRSIQKSTDSLEGIGKILNEFQKVRNSLVHGLNQTLKNETIRPVYSIDESDDD